jgi:ABC-type transport system involved in multi-copper enzyme maturation permease subunit
MRLLHAELAKLARPLSFGVAAAAALFCLLLAAGGSHNAVLGAQGTPRHLPSCAAEQVPAGPQCSRWQAAARARLRRIEAEPAQVAGQLAPAAAGAEAAGLIASLPGALAMALLAGAHVGGEWSGRTMKSLLTQHGRRWQVLVAKLVSLWLAGIGLIATCWAALALAGPVLARVNHLPGPGQTVAHGLSLSGCQVARALLVLAAFAVIGLLAAVITRGAIGTIAATAGAIIAMLAVAALPGAGPWTPATWVASWMGFPAGLGSVTALPGNFWSRFLGAGAPPGQAAGFAGLAGLVVAGLAVAEWIFRRADISG